MGIGPSTKETTLHHFRDPLLQVLSNDEDFDLVGVVIAGIPQSMPSKIKTSVNIAKIFDEIPIEGAIVSADSWGNSNIDFANTLEQLGSRGIEVVGMSFVGTQGEFVVINEYMDTIVDINKSKEGIETVVLGENSMSVLDAKKAAAFLKLKIRRHKK